MEFTLKLEIAASDVDRARTWYSEKLGVEPIDPDTDELLYYAGGTQFGVYASDFAGTNQATAARLVVTDFAAARAELLSKGVVFEEYALGEDFRTVDGVLESPDGEKTSWFKDSEGNMLALGSSNVTRHGPGPNRHLSAGQTCHTLPASCDRGQRRERL